MQFFKKIFSPGPPKDYRLELEIINRAIDAEPGKQKNYDKRSGIYSHLGDRKAALADLEKALSLETDQSLIELRAMEVEEYKKQFLSS